ncbi:tail fiber protein [Atlantibacter subterraneus]|uniref:tail fiber protein n=1 Tax=Atlantibacter subterraneus TaxID=255519 RepID=UPI0029644837|nr:tail fiber protein [Atlantibacter subterranea]MDW2744555.1 tail fiber protein [Atlantibacter subterranea]
MAKNEFKPFAIGAGANVTPQADWEEMPALFTGFQSGKASSAQVNKAIRQASFVASAVAQFISDTLSQDILDNGNSSDFINEFKQAIINGSLPAGVPVPWPAAIPPQGWLKCNGAIFSTAMYPLLAKAYPTGKLPDLRGEFIRGWDDGRGIDTGRVLLSSQAATSIQGSLESQDQTTIIPINNYDAIMTYNQHAVGGVQYSGYTLREEFSVRSRNVAFNYIVRGS